MRAHQEAKFFSGGREIIMWLPKGKNIFLSGTYGLPYVSNMNRVFCFNTGFINYFVFTYHERVDICYNNYKLDLCVYYFYLNPSLCFFK